MIVTRFGTPVRLISSIDQDGWVTVIIGFGGEDDDKQREYHVSELKADNGYNEILDASNRLSEAMLKPKVHLCHDCGQPMQVDLQEQRQAPPLTIVTCKNKACDLWSVTLSTDGYASLNDEQWAEYRTMVSNLKATIAKRKGE